MNQDQINSFPCGICYKNVVDSAVECCLCKYWIHTKCAKLSRNDLRQLTENCYWTCSNCKDNLPFSHITDEELRLIATYYQMFQIIAFVNCMKNVYILKMKHQKIQLTKQKIFSLILTLIGISLIK